MTQTIKKSIGEGFAKGELYAALAYDETDRFGGLRIKGTYTAKTSAATTGTIRGNNIALTMTAASTANVVEALYVSITSNVKTGAWANAIVGKIDYSTSGAAHGMAAAICAEMIPPNSSLARGSLYALDLEFGCGASSTWGSAGPVAFFKMENWGTKTHFSDNAFMFHLLGETSGTGNLLYNNTIRVRVGTTSWYLPLSSAEGNYTTTKTLSAAADRVIDITTTCALTTGAIKSVEIAQTHTAANTASNVEVMKVQLTSDVKTGAWVNAIFGRVNYTVNGWAYGSASAVCGEVSLAPGGSNSGQGTYSVFQGELDVPASAVGIGAECSFIRLSAWGDQVGRFDDGGFLLSITGVTSGSAHLWYDKGSAITTGDASEWIRVKTPGGARYLMLYDSPS